MVFADVGWRWRRRVRRMLRRGVKCIFFFFFFLFSSFLDYVGVIYGRFDVVCVLLLWLRYGQRLYIRRMVPRCLIEENASFFFFLSSIDVRVRLLAWFRQRQRCNTLKPPGHLLVCSSWDEMRQWTWIKG